MKHKKIFLFLIVLFFILTISVGSWKAYQSALLPIDLMNNEKIIFKVEKGSSTLQVAEKLEKEGFIKNSKIFSLYMRLNGFDNKIQAGSYELSKSMAVPEIAAKLIKGEIISKTFTIPEGYNLKQIIKLLTEKGIVDKAKFEQALEKNYDYSFLNSVDKQKKGYLEGYLFPDTYRVGVDVTEEEIIKMMLNRFEEVVYKPFNSKVLEKGLSWHEVVTMASIVEREGKVEEELPIIAGVFYNRLAKGWKLESCATVQYLLPEPKETLSLNDLKIDSPYNTYLNPGLPPGPIASPGLSALKAAIEPADTDYMFFVANDDGTHTFSKTFDAHLSAKNER
ncbi:MAG TPA: endolytic transglycosylase MltG [Clostridia bacterium]|nr:endolytic transglycosylase MltG [Clostridia bacterium]